MLIEQDEWEPQKFQWLVREDDDSYHCFEIDFLHMTLEIDGGNSDSHSVDVSVVSSSGGSWEMKLLTRYHEVTSRSADPKFSVKDGCITKEALADPFFVDERKLVENSLVWTKVKEPILIQFLNAAQTMFKNNQLNS